MMQRIKSNNNDLVGTWSMTASPTVAEALCCAGLDFVIIDMEHGTFSFDVAAEVVRAVQSFGGNAIIRAGNKREDHILKCLEARPDGILIPHISSAKEAENAVRACYYAPQGTRGLSPYTRAHGYDHIDLAQSLQKTNDSLFVGVLLEGKSGMSAISEVAGLKGLDLIYFGIYDFTLSMGYGDKIDHPDVLSALAKMADVCKEKGVRSGTFLRNTQDFAKYKEAGLSFFAYGCDSNALVSYFRPIVQHCRSLS